MRRPRRTLEREGKCSRGEREMEMEEEKEEEEEGRSRRGEG